MYTPPHFRESSPVALIGFLARHPLGALVTAGDGGLDAEHLPFGFEPTPAWHAGDAVGGIGVLRAHVARANPVCQRASARCDALVVFRGDEAYVSPNAYPSKPLTHRAVPTWNYQAVHAHGRLALVDDERVLRRLLAALTRTHEARTGEPAPWRMGDAPRDYLDRMVAAVVVVEVAVTRIEGKFKLSQNRDAADRLGAAARVARHGHEPLAVAMRQAGPSGGAAS